MSQIHEVPFDYIREQLYGLIHNEGYGDVQILSDVDEAFWPLTLHDIVGEDAITRGTPDADSITIRAEGEAEEDGVELRRRNATGGDYADIHQYIRVEATLHFAEDETGEYRIDEANPGDITFVCEVEASNATSHSGERPPF